jgi:NADPH:quinone reductase-like Zn-dependent oxidoreductase
MKALVIHEFGGPEVLRVVDIPIPEPGAGQVRVRVSGSAVNPIDLSTRSGALANSGLIVQAPTIALGWDVSGIVDAIGEGVSRFAVGDAVVGLRDILSSVPGAQAEQVVLDQSALAHAPKGASPIETATLPLNALTADGALRRSGVRRGDSLLITGAVGAVGGFVLQLAALAGVYTIAVADTPDEHLARELGASAFVPRASTLAQPIRDLVPGGVDAVIDAALLGIVAHEALRGGGTFVALVRPFAPPPLRGNPRGGAGVLRRRRPAAGALSARRRCPADVACGR